MIIMLWILPCAICFDLMSYSQKYKRWVGNAQIFKQKQRDRWHHGHVLWHWQCLGVQLSLLLIARKWVRQMCNLWSTETKNKAMFHKCPITTGFWRIWPKHTQYHRLTIFSPIAFTLQAFNNMKCATLSLTEAVRNMVRYCHLHCPPSVMRTRKIF